jgi:two-component system, LytTR family, sensor kinase
VVSFGLWGLVALAHFLSRYQHQQSLGAPTPLSSFVPALVYFSVYALLTPVTIRLAERHPLERRQVGRLILGYVLGGVAFAIANGVARETVFLVRGFFAGTIATRNWLQLEREFLYDFAGDIFEIYSPLIVIGQIMAYHRRFKDREVQLAQAQLQALKSKLQPHFLFNALNSISSLMFTDVRAADKMLSRLSDLLRLVLESDGAQETTLSKELEFLDVYLQVEKFRFEDGLEVIVDAAPATLDANVPQLLLQPLVENAIHHGVAKRSAKGRIRITSRHDCKHLYLLVTDNGPGFETDREPEPRRNGVGLMTTRQRLQTLYGDSQRLTIRNLPEGGAEVCVEIPFSTKHVRRPSHHPEPQRQS